MTERDPLFQVLATNSNPVETVLRSAALIEALRQAGRYGDVAQALLALARLMEDEFPLFAVSLAEYVACEYEPLRGARIAVNIASRRQSEKFRDLVDSARSIHVALRSHRAIDSEFAEHLRVLKTLHDPQAVRFARLIILGCAIAHPELALSVEEYICELASEIRGPAREQVRELAQRSELAKLRACFLR